MVRAIRRPLRLVTRQAGKQPRRTSAWLLGLLLGSALFAVFAVSALGSSSGRRAIRALPADERAAALARTLDDLRALCGPARAARVVEDHCRELASFAAQFDECRGDCAALVQHELARAPTR